MQGCRDGDDDSSPLSIGSDDVMEEKVLGIMYDPQTDTFKFQAKLKLRRLNENVDLIEV